MIYCSEMRTTRKHSLAIGDSLRFNEIGTDGTIKDSEINDNYITKRQDMAESFYIKIR